MSHRMTSWWKGVWPHVAQRRPGDILKMGIIKVPQEWFERLDLWSQANAYFLVKPWKCTTMKRPKREQESLILFLSQHKIHSSMSWNKLIKTFKNRVTQRESKTKTDDLSLKLDIIHIMLLHTSNVTLTKCLFFIYFKQLSKALCVQVVPNTLQKTITFTHSGKFGGNSIKQAKVYKQPFSCWVNT